MSSFPYLFIKLHFILNTMITVGETPLTLEQVQKIIFENTEIFISDAVLQRAKANFEFLREFSSNKVIYGINTGFGPMAQYKISHTDRLTLQYNLIRSHASGMGKPIDVVFSKAMLLDRLSTLACCKSGVHPDLLKVIATMLNKNLIPVIYEHGGVGASGDLVQLAHLALAIIGEGEVFYKGKITPAEDAFKAENVVPFSICLREGLALMNGTSCMTGIALSNLLQAKKLVNWSVLFSATINEMLKAYNDHISEPLNESKMHKGQQLIAASLREILQASLLIRNRHDYLYISTDETHFKEKVQEYYSLRCVPQILGPVWDTLEQATQVVLNELNSVSDNPIVCDVSKNVYHGGNFHGDYVALEMDKLKIAIVKLSMLAERQLNYLLNDKLNDKLPPFINNAVIGLNFGMQGLQFTATSTVAENQSLSTSVYVHSIPNNNDNQDIVSMGSNAALMAARVIENTFEVLSIHALAIAEAIDSLKLDKHLSPKAKQFYTELRKVASPITVDTPQFKTLAAIKNYLKESAIEVI